MNRNEKIQLLSTAMGDIDEKFLSVGKESQKKRKISKNLLILVAMIGILSMGITAGALYTSMNRSEIIFTERWGSSPEQLELIREIGTDVGSSSTDNGITFTVESMLGDKNTAIVVYSITNEDGSPFVLPPLGKGESYTFARAFVDEEEAAFHHTGTDILVTAEEEFLAPLGYEQTFNFVNVDLEDGSVQVMEVFRADTLPMGKWVFTTFKDIILRKRITDWKGETIDIEDSVVYEGFWRMEYLFDYENTGVILAEEQSFLLEEGKVYIEQLEISPFSISMNVYCDKNDRNDYDFLMKIPFYYTTTQGKKVEMTGITGRTYGSSSPFVRSYSVHVFEEITRFEDIASVTFGEITVDVP